jgi:hypothetical protein
MSESPEDLVPQEIESAQPVLNRDGSVRKKPGPKPGGSRKPGARAKAPTPGQRTPAAPKRAAQADFRPALLGLFQIPQLGLGLAAKFAKTDKTRTALVLDGMTVGIHAGSMAEALNTTAQHDEKLARLLDKLSTVGPYSLVISAVLVPIGQVLANHGVMPANPQMGILPPDELVGLAQQMADR